LRCAETFFYSFTELLNCFIRHSIDEEDACTKEAWKKDTYRAIASAATELIKQKAHSRDLPPPQEEFRRTKGGLERVAPRPYILQGRELALYGVRYRQALCDGQRVPAQRLPAALREAAQQQQLRCELCGESGVDMDLVHLVQCHQLPTPARQAKEHCRWGQGDWMAQEKDALRRTLVFIKKVSRHCKTRQEGEPVTGLYYKRKKRRQ